ncbi:MAG TPA: class I SAM-dependent methyltransferase, partial [Dehalococcoidia bacterium]|nr:class I SAM-dependent methyltransferase [Dehalococcoidia bacterium]
LHPERSRAEQTRAIMDEARRDPDSTMKMMKGDQFDRYAGLEPVFALARGKSVLDVGCHRGLIAYEFARHGATVIHGLDLYQPGIQAAREIHSDVPVEYSFQAIDLSSGREQVSSQMHDISPTGYDIVLMLAIVQHLDRQIGEEATRDLVDFFLERTREHFVLRMPRHERIEDFILERGFQRSYFNALDKTLAPVVVYSRSAG